MSIGIIWDIIAMRPVINTLIVMSHYLLGSFGLSIIALTVIIRLLTYPLTIKQLKATKAMQEIQPKLIELQKKYGKDRAKMAQEQMRLYKEAGMSPAGCVVPMLVQLPVWIALYWAIIKLLAVTPEDFMGLSGYLYSWPLVYSLFPLQSQFLWMNLASPDSFLAVLTGATMWAQQKMVQPKSADPRQQQQSQMMLWMMPIMFGFFALSFPSGLSVYWVISNVISIGIQYFVVGGWGGLSINIRRPEAAGRLPKVASPGPGTEKSSQGETGTSPEKGLDDGKSGDERQDRRGSYTASLRKIRRQPRRGGGHRSKGG